MTPARALPSSRRQRERRRARVAEGHAAPVTIRDRITDFRRVPARELVPNPKNWRRHGEAQRRAMRGVLAEIGYADAIIARDTPEGLLILDGHLRAETTPDTLVPVLVTDLSEAEGDTLLTVLDPLAAMADTDRDALRALLDQVTTENAELLTMLGSLERQAAPRGGQTDPDAVPEVPETPVTQPGDVWVLGEHRLLCGDVTNERDVTVLLAGACPGLCVTDPPYGVEYDPAWRDRAAAKGLIAFADRRVGEVTNDDRSDWYEAWARFPGDVIYSWCPAGASNLIHAAALQRAGFALRMQLVWAKPHHVIGRGDYHGQHEPCWYAVREGKPSRRTDDRSQTTLWEITLDKNVAGGHSTQKPVECMARPIRNHEFPDVYDPFLGSGTTLIAAEQLGRRCYALEIEPRYVQVALERWANFTGKDPVREVDGVRWSDLQRTTAGAD